MYARMNEGMMERRRKRTVKERRDKKEGKIRRKDK
jgi:hypothetical protein